MDRSQTSGPPVAAPAEPSHHVVQRHGGLLRRTLLVSALTFASRVLGLVRETQSAALFGAGSPLYDAFLTAWRVPNLFRRFFGEGALSTSLQTALTECDSNRGDAAGRALFLATVRVTTVVLVLLCGVSMALLLYLPGVVESGLLGEATGAAAAVDLTVRVMPFLVLICVSALAAGALQVRGEFRAPTLAPVAMNLVWILVLVWIAVALPERPQLEQLQFLAGGVVLAGAVQLLVLVPSLGRLGLLGSPLAGSGREGWAVLRSSMPFALGAAAYQVNVLIDGLMAEALLSDGGPTALYYANRIQQFPMAMIAVAAAASVFPSLKALAHVRRFDELRALHDRTQLAVLFLALPSTVGLFALSHPITKALLEHGEFSAEGTARVAGAMAIVALALPPAGAIGLTSRLYYALGDLRTPVRLSIYSLVLNTGINYLLIRAFGFDVDGLAWGTVIAAWVNWFALQPGLVRRLDLPPSAPGRGPRLRGIVLASLACGAGALLGRWAGLALGPALGGDLLADVAVVLLGLAGGTVAFVGAASALELEEWRQLRRRLRR